MGFYAVGWRLIRPAHDAILRVVSTKRFEMLCIPRIVQLPHVLQILTSVHNLPHEIYLTAKASGVRRFECESPSYDLQMRDGGEIGSTRSLICRCPTST